MLTYLVFLFDILFNTIMLSVKNGVFYTVATIVLNRVGQKRSEDGPLVSYCLRI